MKGKLVKDALILTIITLVAGLGLGIVYEITKEPIRKAKEEALVRSYKAVFEDADSFEDQSVDAEKASQVLSSSNVEGVSIMFTEKAKNASGETIGYVIGIKSQGFIAADAAFSEANPEAARLLLDSPDTPILLVSAHHGVWEAATNILSFARPMIAVTKDGGEIEAISGATITSRCMTKGINGGIAWFNYLEGGAQ